MSVVAWRDIANWTPSSDEILGIRGEIPDVEIVTLDLLIPIPIGSVSIRTALLTFRQLYNGSPWPIKTTLSMGVAMGGDDEFTRRNWDTISAVERFFKSFWVPV